jgi:hypothetical protein
MGGETAESNSADDSIDYSRTQTLFILSNVNII